MSNGPIDLSNFMERRELQRNVYMHVRQHGCEGRLRVHQSD
jgi:hypothetical protein